MANDDDPVVVTEQTVLETARSKGLHITELLYEDAWEICEGDKCAILPRALVDNGYTQRQIDHIEDAFQGSGVPLFPLSNFLN